MDTIKWIKARFGKRSQAAMEFLMTYGWAILVVLAAIGALAYFGVLSPTKFVPETCTLPSTSGMACIDFKVLPDSAHFFVMNSGGRDLVINNITVGDCSGGFDVDFPDGASQVFNITGCSFGSVGDTARMDLVVSYTAVISDFTKSASGSVIAKIS